MPFDSIVRPNSEACMMRTLSQTPACFISSTKALTAALISENLLEIVLNQLPWESKPPMEQKKASRSASTNSLDLITRATVASCRPSDEPGKSTLNSPPRRFSANFSIPSNEFLRCCEREGDLGVDSG